MQIVPLRFKNARQHSSQHASHFERKIHFPIPPPPMDTTPRPNQPFESASAFPQNSRQIYACGFKAVYKLPTVVACLNSIARARGIVTPHCYRCAEGDRCSSSSSSSSSRDWERMSTRGAVSLRVMHRQLIATRTWVVG